MEQFTKIQSLVRGNSSKNIVHCITHAKKINVNPLTNSCQEFIPMNLTTGKSRPIGTKDAARRLEYKKNNEKGQATYAANYKKQPNLPTAINWISRTINAERKSNDGRA